MVVLYVVLVISDVILINCGKGFHCDVFECKLSLSRLTACVCVDRMLSLAAWSMPRTGCLTPSLWWEAQVQITHVSLIQSVT